MTLNLNEDLNIGILRGGGGNEYNLSLKGGFRVKNTLSSKYKTHDIVLDNEGNWIINGFSRKPETVILRMSIIFNLLNGRRGENGEMQKIFETYKIPYTGSGILASRLSYYKNLSKRIFELNNIRTPVYEVIGKHTDSDIFAKELFNTFPIPAVLKPVDGGASDSVLVIQSLADMQNALRNMDNGKYILEEYINGIHISCGAIDNFRAEEYYPLIPLEVKIDGDILDYGMIDEYALSIPSIPARTKRTIQDMAISAHEVLGMRHYSRSDFIYSPRRGVYLLEVNSIPDMSPNSLFSRSLDDLGVSDEEFLEHILTLALK